jgi:hypothetical protein
LIAAVGTVGWFAGCESDGGDHDDNPFDGKAPLIVRLSRSCPAGASLVIKLDGKEIGTVTTGHEIEKDVKPGVYDLSATGPGGTEHFRVSVEDEGTKFTLQCN